MKKKGFFSLIIIIACFYTMASTSFAILTRASDQIHTYYIYVTPVTNEVEVNFMVSGNGMMDKIGCEQIEVYEKVGTKWEVVESLDEDDVGMSCFNEASYSNTLSCNTEKGVEYKVEVTIFAENDDGRDTRSQTFYVTGK